MSMWTAIALISVAGIIAGIFNDKGKERTTNRADHETNSKRFTPGWMPLESDLRERVETLERIVTNPKEDLKRQFDHLDKVS